MGTSSRRKRGRRLRNVVGGNGADFAMIVAFVGVALLGVLGYAIYRSTRSESAVAAQKTAKVSVLNTVAGINLTSTTLPSTTITTRPHPFAATPTSSAATHSTITTHGQHHPGTKGGGKLGAGNGGGGTGTGSHSGATKPPAPVYGPVNNVHWAANPGTVTLISGGHANGFVVAKNLDGGTGWVMSPGCPSGPHGGPPPPTPGTKAPATKTPAPLASALCAPIGRQTVIKSGKTHTWEWAWNATVDGHRGSAPLAPGNYTFNIGGAVVNVTVTP